MKKIWITLLILALVGIFMTGAGFALGGAKKELYIDWEGIHLDEGTQNLETIKTDLGEITALEIDADSSNIKIVPSETYGFKLNSYSNSSWFEYTFENGRLEISQKHRFLWSLFSLNFKADTIEIYLPKEAALKTTNIKVTSGNLNADGLRCDDIAVKMDSSSIAMSGIVSKNTNLSCTSGMIRLSDCSADRFDFNFTSSTLTATAIRSGEMRLNGISGSATIDGEIKGNTKIKVVSGSVTMNLLGNKEEYSFVSSVVSGSVFVDGKRGNESFTNPAAENALDIHVTSGTVRVNFSD